jgi:hypothetical protein
MEQHTLKIVNSWNNNFSFYLLGDKILIYI